MNQSPAAQRGHAFVIGDAKEPAAHVIFVAGWDKRRCTLTRRAPGIVKGVLHQVIRLLDLVNQMLQKAAQRVLAKCDRQS